MIKRLLVVLCIVEAVIIGYYINIHNSYTPEIQIKEIIRDSIIRDSIYIQNEVIRTEIKYVEKQYQKDSSSIMSASPDELYDSFTRYIEDYEQGHS